MSAFGEGAARLAGMAALLLGWRPEEFWNATPAELASVLQPEPGSGNPDRQAIAELMQRFPDERQPNG